MPVVLIDRRHSHIEVDREVDSVQCDHYLGARQAMEYLVSLGHRCIGLVIGPQRHPPVRDRLQACRDVLQAHGCELDPAYVYETHSYEYDEGYVGVRHLLGLPIRPTAIFAFNDTMAIGVMHGALEQGIAVPGELSIVGVDNIPLSRFVSPCLTTVAQPMTELGRTSAEMLLNRVRDSSARPVQRLLPPELIIRDSTGPAPG